MKALIVTPFFEQPPSPDIVKGQDYSLVLCADTAKTVAESIGLFPDLIIGDFDHGVDAPVGETVRRFPCEKDDTDTMLCLKYALLQGAAEVTVLGGIGGRLDHTVANLQTLLYAARRGCHATLTDGKNEATVLSGSTVIAKKERFYLSVFAIGGKAEGVTLEGVKYPLCGTTLAPDFPLGVSNEITAAEARIEVKSGYLLLILSQKEDRPN